MRLRRRRGQFEAEVTGEQAPAPPAAESENSEPNASVDPLGPLEPDRLERAFERLRSRIPAPDEDGSR